MPEYNPPSNAFYSEVPIPMYINPFKIIGRGGKNLITITEESKCQYIWVDLRRKVVEIWGRESSLPLAISKVRRLIHKTLAKTLKVPDKYYELPSRVRDVLTVYFWKQKGLLMFEMIGPPVECLDFFRTLETKYPGLIIERKINGGIICKLDT